MTSAAMTPAGTRKYMSFRTTRERCAKMLTADEVPNDKPSSKQAEKRKRETAVAKKKQDANSNGNGKTQQQQQKNKVPLSESEMVFAGRNRLQSKPRKNWQGRRNPARAAAELERVQEEGWLQLENLLGISPAWSMIPRARAPKGKTAYVKRVTRQGVAIPGEGDVEGSSKWFTCADCGESYVHFVHHQWRCNYALSAGKQRCKNWMCPDYEREVSLCNHQCVRNLTSLDGELHAALAAGCDDDDDVRPLPTESLHSLSSRRNFYGIFVPVPELQRRKKTRVDVNGNLVVKIIGQEEANDGKLVAQGIFVDVATVTAATRSTAHTFGDYGIY